MSFKQKWKIEIKQVLQVSQLPSYFQCQFIIKFQNQTTEMLELCFTYQSSRFCSYWKWAWWDDTDTHKQL